MLIATRSCFCLSILGVLIACSAGALEMKPSVFDQHQHVMRYNFADDPDNVVRTVSANEESADRGRVGRKSPGKAFFLSLAVPGLGQYYNGNRIKPFLFLGTEVAAWMLYSEWHGEGDDLTEEFEAFNREHWLRERYENQYLLWAYGETDDDSLRGAAGITHHLPETRTQQYYEMTGKYNQFAWGWVDAELNGNSLEDLGQNVPPILGNETTPETQNRITYEAMRHDADVKYSRATKMIFISIANRLVSAFEAFIAARKHNSRVAETDNTSSFLSKLKLKPSLKSYHEHRDTPFLTVTYKF